MASDHEHIFRPMILGYYSKATGHVSYIECDECGHRLDVSHGFRVKDDPE